MQAIRPEPSTESPTVRAVVSRSAANQVRFWNRIAPRYAASAISDPAGYERSLRRVCKLLSPAHEVLELGCGTGATALRLASHCGRLIATDASPAMIAIARERWRAQPTPRLTFAVADAETALDDEARYHCVLAFNLLHLVDDLDALVAAAARTMLPGGLLVTKTPCVGEMSLAITRIGVPLMRALGLAPAVSIFDETRLLSSMQRAGLEPVAVERHGTRGKDIRAFIVARKPEPSVPRAA